MIIEARPYQSEDDFWAMRRFLRRIYEANGCTMRSWHVARLDYARWHMCLNCAHVKLEEVAWLWESEGELIAFTMPDGGPGEAHLCVDPAWQTPELEQQMLEWAEQRLASVGADGGCRLTVWSPQRDLLRQELLAQRGYHKDALPE